MICQKKLLSGVRCRDKAIARTEIGTPLCDYHYQIWIDKLHSKNRAYYKGVVRRREEILHFIWMDCKRVRMGLESILLTVLDNTNYTKRELIFYVNISFDEKHQEFLEKYPNWKELIKQKK